MATAKRRQENVEGGGGSDIGDDIDSDNDEDTEVDMEKRVKLEEELMHHPGLAHHMM